MTSRVAAYCYRQNCLTAPQEETIGVDCVTRGKYGYTDPAGELRQYSYTSGLPCNPDTRKVSPTHVSVWPLSWQTQHGYLQMHFRS